MTVIFFILYLIGILCSASLFAPSIVPAVVKWPVAFLGVIMIVFFFNLAKKDTKYSTKDTKRRIIDYGLINPLIIYIASMSYVLGFYLIVNHLQQFNITDIIGGFGEIFETFSSGLFNGFLFGSIFVLLAIMIFLIRNNFRKYIGSSSLRFRSFWILFLSIISILVGIFSFELFYTYDIYEFLLLELNIIPFAGIAGLIILIEFTFKLIRAIRRSKKRKALNKKAEAASVVEEPVLNPKGYCVYCGAPLTVSEKYCDKCGELQMSRIIADKVEASEVVVEEVVEESPVVEEVIAEEVVVEEAPVVEETPDVKEPVVTEEVVVESTPVVEKEYKLKKSKGWLIAGSILFGLFDILFFVAGLFALDMFLPEYDYISNLYIYIIGGGCLFLIVLNTIRMISLYRVKINKKTTVVLILYSVLVFIFLPLFIMIFLFYAYDILNHFEFFSVVHDFIYEYLPYVGYVTIGLYLIPALVILQYMLRYFGSLRRARRKIAAMKLLDQNTVEFEPVVEEAPVEEVTEQTLVVEEPSEEAVVEEVVVEEVPAEEVVAEEVVSETPVAEDAVVEEASVEEVVVSEENPVVEETVVEEVVSETPVVDRKSAKFERVVAKERARLEKKLAKEEAKLDKQIQKRKDQLSK